VKGRSHFTSQEADQIRRLLREKIESGNEKRFRDTLRGMGFYISDFLRVPDGFSPEDFERCVEQGRITIVGAQPRR
jgi:hypothetical protein